VEPTKPAAVTQPQLPLPTRVRWAIDRGSPDDPQRRSLLVLFYDSPASGWRIIDITGAELFRVPIAGSGIFGSESCVAREQAPGDVVTWRALDDSTLRAFLGRYATYRAIAQGVPAGTATLELVDSGCRGL